MSEPRCFLINLGILGLSMADRNTWSPAPAKKVRLNMNTKMPLSNLLQSKWIAKIQTDRDITHSGCQTSLKAAQFTEKSIVAKRITVAGIYKYIRPKPDKAIKTITDKEGYFGICCIPRFLGGNGNIEDIMEHIVYIAKNYGSDYVGIGTDVVFISIYSSNEN